jgi:hypothetical protein
VCPELSAVKFMYSTPSLILSDCSMSPAACLGVPCRVAGLSGNMRSGPPLLSSIEESDQYLAGLHERVSFREHIVWLCPHCTKT